MAIITEGLGVTRAELKLGTVVMVPVGRIAAQANGHPCIIASATVIGPADADAAQLVSVHDVYWLNVHMGPGVDLPQMYPTGEILGIPALGLAMAQPSSTGVNPDAPIEPHLVPTVTGRGFTQLPPIKDTDGSEIRSYESSAADGPHIWINLTRRDGTQFSAHLSTEDALRHSDQVLHLVRNHYQTRES